MMSWSKTLKTIIRLNEPLKKKTTFKIGGNARFFCEPGSTAELKSLIISAKRDNIPFFVIGGGSNILINDKGVDGLVLKLSSNFFKGIFFKGSCCEAGSGIMLSRLIRVAAENGLSGLEFLAGIPGTLGGALCMNAGAGFNCIGDLVQKVKVMDYDGKIKVLPKKDIRFGYRCSGLEKYIILGGTLKLFPKDKDEIRKNIKKFIEHRRNTQDTVSFSAGCIFKNPPGESAGKLIDMCGLKGKSQGQARISLKHANFILNTKQARSGDVIKLISLIEKKVKQKFNVVLEQEIKIWG